MGLQEAHTVERRERSTEKEQLTIGSLFDGIGGFPYAASFYGIRPVWASEIIPECISVTKRHIPEMPHAGDITKLSGRELAPADIITFGSPCQGLSIAGQRRGLADERSGLFSEAVRIIREMQEVTHGRYPQIAVWENVPGALSSAGGRDFRAVLEALTESEIPMPCSGRWAKAGMVRSGGTDLAWCVYDAQYFGTAQRRRRVFLVADFGGTCAGEILFVPKSLYGYFAAGGTPRQGITAYAQDCAGGTGERTVEILNDQGGSSISVESGGVSPTLRSETHGNLPVIATTKGVLPAITMRIRQGCEGGGKGALLQIEKSGTLATGNDQYLFEPPHIKDRLACGFDLQQITSRTNRTTMKPIQPTLCAGGSPHVVHPKITGTLCASGAGLSRPAGMANETDLCVVTPGQAQGYLVRRLTPTECERLQGYPDGWTAHGHDGKPISDSKRYQMLGNSIAVPCVAYIMQGISGVLQRRCC